MGRPKMTEEEKAAKAALKEEEKAAKAALKEEEKSEEPVVEAPEKVSGKVATVEVAYKMKYNVLHNGVKYQQGDFVPDALLEDFMEKGFVDKELKEI